MTLCYLHVLAWFPGHNGSWAEAQVPGQLSAVIQILAWDLSLYLEIKDEVSVTCFVILVLHLTVG